MEKTRLLELSLDRLIADEDNVRRQLVGIDELAQEVRRDGILQPILVRLVKAAGEIGDAVHHPAYVLHDDAHGEDDHRPAEPLASAHDHREGSGGKADVDREIGEVSLDEGQDLRVRGAERSGECR